MEMSDTQTRDPKSRQNELRVLEEKQPEVCVRMSKGMNLQQMTSVDREIFVMNLRIRGIFIVSMALARHPG